MENPYASPVSAPPPDRKPRLHWFPLWAFFHLVLAPPALLVASDWFLPSFLFAPREVTGVQIVLAACLLALIVSAMHAAFLTKSARSIALCALMQIAAFALVLPWQQYDAARLFR